jgi:hypothetical protein
MNELKCDVCDLPIRDIWGGVMDVDPHAARRVCEQRAEVRFLEQPRPGDIRLIEPAKWRVAHKNCTTDDANFYWFTLARIDPPAKALGWTWHLSEKPWFDGTDWFDVMERFGHVEDA